VLLKDVPAKLAVGDIIGLRCSEKKYQFRVVWAGMDGTSEAGSVGLQSLDPGKWIWENLRLPLDDIDIYTRPPECERRLLNRSNCLISSEILCGRSGQKILAFVTNIGLGGCYVSMSSPLATEMKVSIALWLTEQRKIWVDGIVVSSHPQSGMGVKFLGMGRRNLEALERYIDELLQQDGSSASQLPKQPR
jgi:hypothetical protein